MLGIARDISERNKMEAEKEKIYQEMVKTEKMTSIGILSAGIAHEFNNILAIVRSSAELAFSDGSSSEVKDILKTIIDISDRGATIVKSLLAFSQQQKTFREKSSVTEILDSILGLIEHMLKKNSIKVIKDYEKVPDVELYRGEIQQVFLHLFSNAKDAMFPKGGVLGISVRNSGDSIEIRVSDTGIGIKKEDLYRIFEPFFTTKGSLSGSSIPGTGLGLSVAYGIIKKHNGTIEAESQEGKGSTFKIKLPLQ